MAANDRFESFTVEAQANTTADTVELRLHTESGWLSHLVILTQQEAWLLGQELQTSADRLMQARTGA